MLRELTAEARAVLDFWFLPSTHPQHGKPRREWFSKDAAFDRKIADRFGGFVENAVAGGWCDWDATTLGTLARIVVLDQFTRNIFRGTPRAFAGDPLALEAAERFVAEESDRGLPPVHRWFAYLPFEHAEFFPAQEKSVALFRRLNAEEALSDTLDYALRHYDVVQRFGRFPHRNAILGRPSTPEEEAFLRLPGSSF